MKILLLGANSYLGARVYFELSKHYNVVGTFHDKKIFDKFLPLDITNKQTVASLIHKEKPEVIIHAANNASSKWCREHPKEAVKLNQEATRFVVEAANEVYSKLIYISSFAAISPSDSGIYGQTKAGSELIVQKTQAGYIILRPSIVVGFSPKWRRGDGIFNSLLRVLDNGVKAEYDNSKKYQPTYLYHIYEVIESLVERNVWNKVVHVSVKEAKTKYDLAKSILTPFGISVTPIDEHELGSQIHDLAELKELNLPQYTYDQIIEKVIEEIKHRERFVL